MAKLPQSQLGRRLVPVAAFALLAVGLVAVNVLASMLPVSADVTDAGLYTLSEGSQEIVSDLHDPVTLKVYYTQGQADIPVSFKQFAQKAIQLMREFAAESGGMLRVEMHDPQPDSDAEQWATRYGLSPARLPDGTQLFFGVVALSADREAQVPFLDPRREKFLEYDLAQMISRVNQVEQQTIGVLSYLPVQGQRGPRGGGQEQWAFVQELQKAYPVEFLAPDRLVEVPESIKTLLVIHPKQVPARVAYAIDQFVLRGGKVMLFVDPNSRVDPGAQSRFGGPTNSNLPTLLNAWGIDYQELMVVGDHNLATDVNTQRGPASFPIWLTLGGEQMQEDSVITAELEDMILVDPGAVMPTEDMPYDFTPLLQTSDDSGLVDFSTVRMIDPNTIAQMVEPDGTRRNLAGMLTGTFSSAFPDGPPPPPEDDEEQQQQQQRPEPELPERTRPHLAEGEAETTVIVVGDVDFLHDRFSVRTMSFLGNQVSRPVNDNLNFVLNSAEFMMGSQALIHIRSRGQFTRPFTRVQNLQDQAQERYLQQEQRLSQQLQEVQAKLSRLEQQRERSEGELMLSEEQLDEIRQFRLEEQRTRTELRDVRRLLREDIVALGNRLLAVNLLAMPLVVAVFGFVVIWRRSKRSGGAR